MVAIVSTYLFSCLALFLIIKNFVNLGFAVHRKKLLLVANEFVDQEVLFTLEKIRPMVFIKFFATCLTIPFLSQYILTLAHQAGAPPAMASFAYITYTVVFTLMIVPSGYLVETKNLKTILLVMLLAEAGIFFVLGMSSSFWVIFALQMFFGLVVPISSSAEYAYIFLYSNQHTRAQAIARYMNTLRGAMVAGIFCGGLFLHFVADTTVLLIAGFLVCCCFIYAIFLIPRVDCTKVDCSEISVQVSRRLALKTALKNLPRLLKDVDFMFASLLVAFPLAIISEGVVLFALPILLAKTQIAKPLIGQILVLFTLGFFVTNRFIAKKADQGQKEKRFIIFGAIGMALAVAVIAFFKSNLTSVELGLGLLVLGLFGLGLFKGFMLSPALSLVSKSGAANLLGKNTTVAAYRLFESMGKTVGPLLIGGLLIATNYSTLPLLLVAVCFLLLTLLVVTILNII